jgi:hypothetical protein
MPDLFDTARIPDDDKHWDALASRVAAAALRPPERSAVEWLAQARGSWMAASLILVSALALLALRTRGVAEQPLEAVWESSLAPTEGVGRAMTGSDGPPPIGALLLPAQGGG